MNRRKEWCEKCLWSYCKHKNRSGIEKEDLKHNTYTIDKMFERAKYFYICANEKTAVFKLLGPNIKEKGIRKICHEIRHPKHSSLLHAIQKDEGHQECFDLSEEVYD